MKPISPFSLRAIPPIVTKETAGKISREYASKLFQEFFQFPIENAQKVLVERTSQEWESEGQTRALDIFHSAAERVPAYKDFLKKNKIQHEKIKTINDFSRHVPVVDKDNYLRVYSLEKLCWDENFPQSNIISISSGSTGKPFLWPRDIDLEMEVTYFFELIANSFFKLSEYKTLIVDCFAMGMYVGGPFFLNAYLRIAQKGYEAQIVTPGNVMDDILRVIQELLPHYEQIILSGYPPFLKDVIENGKEAGIDWSKVRTILFPAGEGFSELWRDTVAEYAGDTNPIENFLGYYGTADAAVLGFETPWSVVVRKAIADKIETIEQIFGERRLPSFMQYLPALRYFESVNNELHFTSSNGCIPLIRYNIHDHGGLIAHDELMRVTNEQGLDVATKIADTGRSFDSIWKLPYVYVFGRSDHTAILFGANVYPENIKAALEKDAVSQYCTGRFSMAVEEDHFHNNYLVIHVECQKGIEPNDSLRKLFISTITIVLEEINSEYVNAKKAIGDRAIPQVVLHEYGDKKYFERDRKQKWKQ